MSKLLIAAAFVISFGLASGNALATPAPKKLPVVVTTPAKPIVSAADEMEQPQRRKPLRFNHVQKLKCKIGLKPIKGVCRPQYK